jgi:rubredoxin
MMKKTVCEYCGFEYRTPEGRKVFDRCPFCGLDARYLQPIPDHETVAEWEKRRGEKYPDTAPVYARMKGYEHLASWLCEIKIIAERDESMCEPFVVATEAGAPPNDWRPE